jgi:CRISPR-associated RAMP protein (TIGR02581 family)
MNSYRNFSHRFLFKGQIEMITGLHIGGGRATLSTSDSPVVRTPEGHPFVPGSSFKGAFRSVVEKLSTAVAGLKTCSMADNQSCVGVQGEAYQAFNKRRGREKWSDSRLLQELDGKLCDTCLLFGSLFLASKILFDDLYLINPEDTFVQVRDGVAIDRDSEKAVDRLKYDYEVVPATQVFNLNILLEEPGPIDLGLTCIGLSEYLAGFGQIGGKRSRGLGRCQLTQFRVFELDLEVKDATERGQRLKKYLLGKKPEDKMSELTNTEGFIQEKIDDLLNEVSKKGGH